LEALASLTPATGYLHLGAQFLGVAARVREEIGSKVHLWEADAFARYEAEIRDALGNRRFAREVSRGHELTIDEVIALVGEMSLIDGT
jgi:hypothetical protein